MAKKNLIVFLVVLSLMFFIFSMEKKCHAGEKIYVAESNWSEQIITCHLICEILENYLNIPAETKTTSIVMGWVAMDKGSIDIFPGVWWPNQQDKMEKYVEQNKTVKLQLLYSDIQQGFWVPTWVAKKYNINSVFDINKHTEIFDRNGDGVGDIWIGGFGWISNDIHRAKIKCYDLNVAPYVVEEWVFLTQLEKAMRNKRPIVFYYYEPSWIFLQFDLTFLAEPEYDPDKWNFNDKEPEKSTICCEWQPAEVYVGYVSNLWKKSPEAYKFIQNMTIPKDDMYQLIADMEDIPGNPPKKPRDVAAKWISNNPKIVNAWLKGVR